MKPIDSKITDLDCDLWQGLDGLMVEAPDHDVTPAVDPPDVSPLVF